MGTVLPHEELITKDLTKIYGEGFRKLLQELMGAGNYFLSITSLQAFYFLNPDSFFEQTAML